MQSFEAFMWKLRSAGRGAFCSLSAKAWTGRGVNSPEYASFLPNSLAGFTHESGVSLLSVSTCVRAHV